MLCVHISPHPLPIASIPFLRGSLAGDRVIALLYLVGRGKPQIRRTVCVPTSVLCVGSRFGESLIRLEVGFPAPRVDRRLAVGEEC